MPFNRIVVVDQRPLHEWPWWVKDIGLKFNTIIECIDQDFMFFETSCPRFMFSKTCIVLHNELHVECDKRDKSVIIICEYIGSLPGLLGFFLGFFMSFLLIFLVSVLCFCSVCHQFVSVPMLPVSPTSGKQKYLHKSYVDDVLSINNTKFGDYLDRIYPTVRGKWVCYSVLTNGNPFLFLIRYPQCCS